MAPVAGLSVVLPAFNEEESIRDAVLKAVKVLPGLATEWEVIVVDDGSRDQTGAITESLVDEHQPRVRLLRHPSNRGYGTALRTGFAHARHDLVFYTDSDNQFDVGELRELIPLMDDHDVAIGFREKRKDTRPRLIVSWFYNWLARLVFGIRIRDINCAFKLFRREVFDVVSIESDNFFVDTEMLAKIHTHKLRLVERGVSHFPRTAGQSTVRSTDILHTLVSMVTLWRRIRFPTAFQRGEAAESRTKVLAENLEYRP